MLLSAEYTDKETADAILSAAVKSMEHYGRTNEAFDSIKLLGTTEAKPVVYTDRSVVAAVFGAVLCVIATILAMLLLAALNDAIYVPEDAEARYGIPVLGVTFDKNIDGFFRNELMAACNKFLAGATEVAVISTDSLEDESKSSKDCDMIKQVYSGVKFIPLSVPGKVLDNYRKIGTADGVILCVPYGVSNGTMTEHIITQLKKHECPVLGIVISRADYKFMRRYYRIAK